MASSLHIPSWPPFLAPGIVLSRDTARILPAVDARATTKTKPGDERERTAELRVMGTIEDGAMLSV
jgi:hypothetical protein